MNLVHHVTCKSQTCVVTVVTVAKGLRWLFFCKIKSAHSSDSPDERREVLAFVICTPSVINLTLRLCDEDMPPYHTASGTRCKCVYVCVFYFWSLFPSTWCRTGALIDPVRSNSVGSSPEERLFCCELV